MKQISKKRKTALLIISLLLAVVIGVTIAYFSSRKDFENEFRVKEPGVAMEEKFNPADHWVPGEEKSKEVWFKNTGQMDMFLRFSVEVEWDESVPHPNRDPEKVVSLNWYGGEGENGSIRIPATPSGGSYSDAAPEEFIKVVQDEKAYYYYTKVLKAGESTKHTLESVKFAADLSNDGHKNSDFSNTQLLVTIRGETVLAVPEAVEEWNENENGEMVSPQIKAVIKEKEENGDIPVDWQTVTN